MTMHQKLWLYIIHDCHCFSSCVIWHHCLLAVFLCVHNFSNRKFYSCQIESYYFSPHSQMVFRVRKVGIEGILPNFDCFIQHLQFTNHLLKNSSEIMFSNLLAKRKILKSSQELCVRRLLGGYTVRWVTVHDRSARLYVRCVQMYVRCVRMYVRCARGCTYRCAVVQASWTVFNKCMCKKKLYKVVSSIDMIVRARVQ